METQWHWDKPQQDAFDLLKDCVTSTQVFRYYSPEEPIVVTIDSSSYGLGACLLQDDKPVAFASRSLSKSEKNYGQIEKEMLAIAWLSAGVFIYWLSFYFYPYGLYSYLHSN